MKTDNKMNPFVLKTNNLTKSYHGVDVLNQLSVNLEAGKIYGLIGQNGAGKTTFMRMIAGHSFPTSGNLELFGHTGEKELQIERKRIGCMIEYPSLTPNMTARENLRIHRIMRGIPNIEVETELLELVGLGEESQNKASLIIASQNKASIIIESQNKSSFILAGKKKVKNFSLGMKQRLGIAIALLGNPELIILDEPINGLDPIGIVEIRNLLKKLCEERQLTILISSHNLPELYQTATDYIILHKGEIKKTLTLAELEECCKHYIHICCEQPDELASILELKLNTTNYMVMPDKSIKLFDYLNEKERVSRVLFENGIVVTNLSKEGDSLEDYFISVVGGEKLA